MNCSEVAFKEALDEGALSLVTALAEDSSDVLLQLNALDLLELVIAFRELRRVAVRLLFQDRLTVR